MKKDNKLFKLVDNIIVWTDCYFNQFATENGKINYSESAVSDLNKIINEIFMLNNYIVENKLYTDNNEILLSLVEINKYADKLKINEENAKKLDVKKAINYWENIHQLGFKIAYIIACDKEYYKEKK